MTHAGSPRGAEPEPGWCAVVTARDRYVIVLALLVVLALVAGAVGVILLMADTGEEVTDPEDEPGLVTTATGPNCLDAVSPEDGSWLHTVPADNETHVVSFTLWVAHEQNETVAVDMETDDEATIALEATESDPDEVPWETPDCPAGTTLSGHATVGPETEAVDVTANETTLASLGTNETAPEFQSITDPVELDA